MLSLASPLWLFALAILPLIWWLQRFHELDRAQSVAALFLWRGRDADGALRRRSRRTDPLWWLRALTAALLVLALCGPRCSESDAGSLVVWVDDSASMFAREHNTSRMQQALAAMEAELAATGFTSITLQSLAAPGEHLVLDSRPSANRKARLQQWTASMRGEAKLPARVSMDATATHWLVSDGASPGLAQWVRQAPIARVFTSGDSTENVAVTALSLRADSDREGGAGLLVTLANGGRESARRTLEISAGGGLVSTRPLTIAAGGNMRQLIRLPDGIAPPITARLRPADALSLDDSLALSDTDMRRVSVTVSARCGKHLRAALAVHPGLSLVEDKVRAAGLQVFCGADDTGQPGPALYSAGQRNLAPVQGPLIWHLAAGHLRDMLLDPAWLVAAPPPTTGPEARALLANRDGALLQYDIARRVIVSRLDLAAPGLVNRPEYPLLIGGLVDLLLGENANKNVVSSSADPNPVRIAPMPLPLGPALASRIDPRGLDLTGALISAAIVALLLDLLLAGRRRGRHAPLPATAAGVR